jgi:hypothetical protein
MKKKKKKRERKFSATYSIFFGGNFHPILNLKKFTNFLSHFDSDFAFVAFFKAVFKTIYTSSNKPFTTKSNFRCSLLM